MKIFIKISIVLLFSITLLLSENLTSKYKQMMSIDSLQIDSTPDINETIVIQNTSTKSTYEIIDEIKKIQR